MIVYDTGGTSFDVTMVVNEHIALTRDRGVYLAELFDLEGLSHAARATFMLVIAPLAIRGGVGSPITPVAVL